MMMDPESNTENETPSDTTTEQEDGENEDDDRITAREVADWLYRNPCLGYGAVILCGLTTLSVILLIVTALAAHGPIYSNNSS